MIQIDGNTYNVPIISLVRKAEFLDKYATRTENGDMQRELIGVYFNYQLKLGVGMDAQAYDAFWEKVTEPQEFHSVSVPYGRGIRTFHAYFASVQDELLLDKGGERIFTGMTVNFIAKSPARTT